MSYPKKYLKKLNEVIGEIEINNSKGQTIPLESAFKKILGKLKKLDKKGNKIIFIGNGGSAAIASHQAIDYWKNGGIPALAFNDASLLTCLSNDYGYEFVFEKPINMFANQGDILIAISSSGKSKNITNAIKAAKKKNLYIITMSGFSKNNQLYCSGDLNFYVPSNMYGHVEITHLVVCHTILDNYLNTTL